MPVIFGIGTDIIEVDRIQRLLNKDEGFRSKIFRESERHYCESKKKFAENYAARFAAKEAFFKALGTGWRGEMAFNEIEVTNDNLGKPSIRVHGKVKEILELHNVSLIHLSLSHVKALAVAIVILEKD